MSLRTLENLKPAPGSNRKKKRIGRGIGSGWGKTAGKGHKGQKARKGGGIAPGFEGGQMPLYRRVPKRGFTPRKTTTYNVINLDQLKDFPEGSTINAETLLEKRMLRLKKSPIKILARGKLDKKLNFKVDKISGKAKELIEAAGGKIEG